jgi:hypothetical protein
MLRMETVTTSTERTFYFAAVVNLLTFLFNISSFLVTTGLRKVFYHIMMLNLSHRCLFQT